MSKIFLRNYMIFTAILVACVAGLAYFLIAGNKNIDKADKWIFQTHKIIVESEELNALVSNMLAAQRGFIITADQKFLDEYEDKKAAASRNIANLSDLTSDNPSQQSRLAEMRTYFSSFSKHFEDRIVRIRVAPTKNLSEDMDTANGLKNNIVRLNADFLAEEYKLFSQRIRYLETRKDQYFWTLLVGGTVAFVLLMIFNGYLLRVQSKRSAAESALGEQEEVFRLAIEGTQDGVFDWNVKTDDVFYSEQFITMLGYEPNEFEGNLKDFTSKLHEEEKEKVQEYIDLYLDGQLSEYSNTFRMQHKSGRWVWIHSRAKLTYDKDGKPIRMIGAHTDISASKEYEMRLQEAKVKAEEANRAKTDFLAHMSHEIRTPLTTISGAAEILDQNKLELDEKKQKLVSALTASSTILKDLISDILDFSKIEGGELELDEQTFDLAEAFEHVVSIMATRAGEQGLDFSFKYEKLDSTQFYGDPIRLRQILINLIGNAIKFTEKGSVHVTAHKDKHNDVEILRIDIKDTGIGLAEEHHDVIFERFKQADASVSRKYGGTGLGLPISKKLAVLMGGDIQLQSKLGKGSEFSLILPMREVKDPAKDQDKDSESINKINEKLKSTITDTDKVLLVEDYDGNIVVLSHILEEMDIQFDVAQTGLEALNQWKEHHYDLVLMDIQMPEMDGFTATAHIRKIEDEQNLARTPIIGMTAHALVGDKGKCIEAGMDAYLPKPINEADLKKNILKYLKQRQKAA